MPRLPITYRMQGLGDFQRRQMKRGDPRVQEFFSHMRRILDLLEDIVMHPHNPPAAAEPLAPAPEHKVTTAAPMSQAEVSQTTAPMLVSVKEACRLIGIGNTRIYELINAGTLETVRIGKRRMVRYKSLQKFAGS